MNPEIFAADRHRFGSKYFCRGVRTSICVMNTRNILGFNFQGFPRYGLQNIELASNLGIREF